MKSKKPAPSDKSVLNIAVIGCGMFARGNHLPNITALPGARLHTCCDIHEDNLQACRPFDPIKYETDFSKVLSDDEVDVVVIATTESYRLPIIKAAAQKGLPVFSEKPLADSLENALKIEAVVNESGIPFCVGHNRRCSPAIVEARKIFHEHLAQPEDCAWRFRREPKGALNVGPYADAPVVNIRINDDWMSWKAVHLKSPLNRQVGLVLSEGTHFVDIACWFLDAKPTRVFCTGVGILNHAIVIHFENDAMAVITMAATGSFGYPKELVEAIGAGGVVAIDHMLEVRTAGINRAPLIKKYPMLNDRHPQIGTCGGLHGWLEKKRAACEEAATQGNPSLQFTAEPDKGHKRMLEQFFLEVRGQRDPVCPVADAVCAVRTCLAAATSYLEKREVSLEEIARNKMG